MIYKVLAKKVIEQFLTSAVIITCIGGLAAVLGANSGMSLPNLSSDDTGDMDNDYNYYA